MSAQRRGEGDEPARGRVAIVDIGSNSIRLVVYDRPSRAFRAIFNEKVLCGLGRSLARTGRLDPDGIGLALANLRRFAALARAMGVADIDAVATAAVREAEDGPAFVAEVERLCRFPVRVVSGEEEAWLSALGVVAAIPGADGFMGDLGGASLELVGIDDGRPGAHLTLPFGPQRIAGEGKSWLVSATQTIDAALARLPWLSDMRDRTFFPVGGAWRALARVHMAQTGYPLRVIHHYAISRAEAADFLGMVVRLSPKSLERIAGVPRKRLETLPAAALLLARLLEVSAVRRIVFSAYGLREGCLYARLDEAERARDPLLVACAELAAATMRFPGQEGILADWIGPLFTGETPAQRRLREAAALLADIAWNAHPDYRADQAYDHILRMPVVGLDHQERAFLALALHARYDGEIGSGPRRPPMRLLDEELMRRAELVGLALRLGQTLSGGVASVLRDAALRHADGRLVLDLSGEAAAMAGEVVERRLAALARALGAKGSLVTEG